METFKVTGDVKINKLQTEIPKLPIEPSTSKKRILLAADEVQLWYIYLGLERLNLVPSLNKATSGLAQEIHKLGKKTYKWYKI